MDLAILVDGSGSIKRNNFLRVKSFLKKLIDSLVIGFSQTRVALVQFSRSARVEFYFKRYGNARSVINAINRMRQMRSGTYLHRGLKLTRTKVFQRWSGDRPNAPNTLLILSDGATKYYKYARQEALNMKRLGVHVMSVGIGNPKTVRRFYGQLRSYASSRLVNNVFQHKFSGLDKIARKIGRMACKSKSN